MKRQEFILNSILGGMALTSGQILPDASKKGPLAPFYLPPMAPLQPGPGGTDIRTWVRSSQTNMQFSCVECAVAPKTMGPAPHIHKKLDEICYVLEGTAWVMVEDEVFKVEAGGFHLRPHGIKHTFWNASDQPLRFMDLYFNQNFEDFLEEIYHDIFVEMGKKNLTPADPAISKRLDELGKRFEMVSFPEQRQAIVEQYGLR